MDVGRNPSTSSQHPAYILSNFATTVASDSTPSSLNAAAATHEDAASGYSDTSNATSFNAIHASRGAANPLHAHSFDGTAHARTYRPDSRSTTSDHEPRANSMSNGSKREATGSRCEPSTSGSTNFRPKKKSNKPAKPSVEGYTLHDTSNSPSLISVTSDESTASACIGESADNSAENTSFDIDTNDHVFERSNNSLCSVLFTSNPNYDHMTYSLNALSANNKKVALPPPDPPPNPLFAHDNLLV